jgi:hypothetical protein
MKGEKHVAKFFPCFNGPYEIIQSHLQTVSYTLDLPNSPNIFPTSHASKLKPHFVNDATLFSNCELPQPRPIITDASLKKYFVEDIIDSCCHGHGWQYLVHCSGFGPEHD